MVVLPRLIGIFIGFMLVYIRCRTNQGSWCYNNKANGVELRLVSFWGSLEF